MYVGNLARTTTSDSLREYFSTFDGFKHAHVPEKGNTTTAGQRYGFVTFDAPASAVACIEFTATHKIDEKVVNVKHSGSTANNAGTGRSEKQNRRNKVRSTAPSLYQKQQQSNVEQRVKDRDLEGAWRMFDDKRAAGVSRLFEDNPTYAKQQISIECNMMCLVCESSEHMWELINVNENAGLTPDAYIFNTYVTQLMIEGKYEKAKQTVDTIMIPMGIENTAKVKVADNLALTEERLQKLRSSKIKHMFEGGQRTAVKKLFNALRKQDLLQTNYFNSMIKHSYSSDDIWETIDVTMKQDGVKPDVTSFFLYMKALVTEGNYAEAQRIPKSEMMPLGLDLEELVKTSKGADVRNLKGVDNGLLIDNLLNKFTEEEYSAMRTFKLTKLREEGGTEATEAAWKLLNNLIENNVANVEQFNSTMMLCHDTDQMAEMMNVTMKNAGVEPSFSTMRTYGARLMVEGNIRAAQEISVPSEELIDKVPLDTRRTETMDFLMNLGGNGVVAAETLLQKLHDSKLNAKDDTARSVSNATPAHYFAMIDQFVNTADTSTKGNGANDDLMRALYWYRLGKPKNIKAIKIDTIDISGSVRGVATMKVVDGLLQLRSQWVGALDGGDDLLLNIQLHGKSNDTNIGAVIRTLQNQFNPSIASTIQGDNVVLKKEDLVGWMDSEQAKEWSRRGALQGGGD